MLNRKKNPAEAGNIFDAEAGRPREAERGPGTLRISFIFPLDFDLALDHVKEYRFSGAKVSVLAANPQSFL